MANHFGDGDGPAPDVVERFKKMMEPDAMTPRLGPTKDYPAGMYGPSDQGGIAFGVAADKPNRKVVLNFGAPVAWLAMDPEQARQLGFMLLQKASDATPESERPVTMGR